MIKKIWWIYVFIILISGSALQAQSLSEKLSKLSLIYNFTFEEIKTDTFFTEKYLLTFEQYLDHKEKTSKRFSQRVFLSHFSFDKPVVFITEGYAAEYANHPRYINELSTILEANQICVEHRYFGESVPENADWKYLNIYNAASDHHRIVEVLKNLYNGKWVNTGISKGGQTTMYHRYFYPEDVDASVGYVCPLNFSIEDKRVYRFLDQVGDSADRNKIYSFQKELLEHKSTYLPEFENLAERKGLSFKIGMEKAYELTVLEYSFAFWQWGSFSVSLIPIPAVEPKKMISHLDQVAGLNWISDQGINNLFPFFYQAMSEVGFYGYDIDPFREWVSFDTDPVFTFTIPDSLEVHYNPEPMQKVDFFIRHQADNMMFIYGETDPWSATAAEITYSNNVVKIVKPKGSHTTRINNLPPDLREPAVLTLKKWLNFID